MKKILIGLALVGGVMSGNCSQSYHTSEATTPFIEQSSVLSDSIVLPKSTLLSPNNAEFDSLIPTINEINEVVTSCEEDDIKNLSNIIINEMHILNCFNNNNFAKKARFFMTENILSCQGKRALLWSYVAQDLGGYISDETIGQIYCLLRNRNY